MDVKMSFRKNYLPSFIDSYIMSLYLIICIYLTFLFRTYLKEMCLWSFHFGKILCFKFKARLKNYLLKKWHQVNKNCFYIRLCGQNLFTFKIGCQRHYVQNLYINKSLVAAILPIIVKPNFILKSKFANI